MRVIVIILTLLNTNCFSQYRETIQSGRPGQANGILSLGEDVY